MLGVSKRTVWRLIETGTLVSLVFQRTRLVTAESLTKYASSGRAHVTAFAKERPSSPAKRVAYRVDEVAAMLGVTRRTVHRALADGRLKSSKERGARLIQADSLGGLSSGDPRTRHEGR
jgi:excisionase family DNA binding protein